MDDKEYTKSRFIDLSKRSYEKGVYTISDFLTSAELFSSGRVFCDGRLMENESKNIKNGEVISVRGFGKFVYSGVGGTSKKGNMYVTVQKYV